jgi:hypothetical protein
MISAALPLAGFAMSTMVKGISNLYGVAGDMNTWTNDHILGMQKSENQTIAQTGKVLEGAKFGFGVGYIAPVTVIAVGQHLLGFTTEALATLVTTGTLTNPFAMTCAAVGAIYFGWNALSDQERNEALDNLSAGLQIGIEFIKSVINFIISTSKEWLSKENLDVIKNFVRKTATLFGKKLSDITRTILDHLSDAAQTTKEKATKVKVRIKKTLDQNGDGQIGVDDLVHVGKRLKGNATQTPKDTE